MAPDPFPEEKAFYRSDHYAFVKRGVPSLMLLGGPGGDIAPWLARAKKWLVTDYHQPTDTVRPDWNWDGARALAVVGLIVGTRVANAEAMPAWLTSSPFNHPRGTDAPSQTGQ
jgi:Zn-dependent M28 family amino/carboxypeptidase